jgi:predicted RNA-binding protein
MCQATVYMDDKMIMQDVMLVEPVKEGVRLTALFEPVQVVPASILRIDLMKHRVILESLKEGESTYERSRKTAGTDSALD